MLDADTVRQLNQLACRLLRHVGLLSAPDLCLASYRFLYSLHIKATISGHFYIYYNPASHFLCLLPEELHVDQLQKALTHNFHCCSFYFATILYGVCRVPSTFVPIQVPVHGTRHQYPMEASLELMLLSPQYRTV